MAHNSSSSSSNAMAVVTGAAGQVAADMINKGLVAPIMGQIDSLIHMDRNNLFLQDKLERMKKLLQDISNAFENQQRVPQKSIAYWLARMRDAIQEARDLSAKSEQNQKRMHWVFYKLSISGQITELNAKFDRIFRELKEDFSIFEKAQQIVSTPPPPEVFLQPVPDGGFVGSGFESAETQLQTWITAEAPQVRRFGVYGLAGVGKTSLLKSVYNFSKVSHVFDVLIWLTVSRAYKISDLQNSVGRAINLNFSTTDDNDTKKMALFQI